MTDQPVAVYRLGDVGVAVRSIRALLQATSDLAAPAEASAVAGSTDKLSDVYDDELARAVRAFQQRRGLIADGVVGPHPPSMRYC